MNHKLDDFPLIEPFIVDANDTSLVVSVSEQKMFLIRQGEIHKKYTVSTALAGTGNEEGSNQTPLGIHRIAEKIGAHAPAGTLFKARKSTHEYATTLAKGEYSTIDAITSRILWLDGLEPGKNKGMGLNSNVGKKVDSYQRFIYIHGTNEEWLLGQPASHGCIRMSNTSIIELYDKVCVNTLVVIIE